jgi:hypothetical protein
LPRALPRARSRSLWASSCWDARAANAWNSAFSSAVAVRSEMRFWISVMRPKLAISFLCLSSARCRASRLSLIMAFASANFSSCSFFCALSFSPLTRSARRRISAGVATSCAIADATEPNALQPQLPRPRHRVLRVRAPHPCTSPAYWTSRGEPSRSSVTKAASPPVQWPFSQLRRVRSLCAYRRGRRYRSWLLHQSFRPQRRRESRP